MKVRSSMTEFSKERIGQLVREYIKQTLEDDGKCRALGVRTIGNLYVTGGCSMGQEEAVSLDISVKRWLKEQDYSFLHPVANTLLAGHGIEIAPESDSYKALSRELIILLKVRNVLRGITQRLTTSLFQSSNSRCLKLSRLYQ